MDCNRRFLWSSGLHCAIVLAEFPSNVFFSANKLSVWRLLPVPFPSDEKVVYLDKFSGKSISSFPFPSFPVPFSPHYAMFSRHFAAIHSKPGVLLESASERFGSTRSPIPHVWFRVSVSESEGRLDYQSLFGNEPPLLESGGNRA